MNNTEFTILCFTITMVVILLLTAVVERQITNMEKLNTENIIKLNKILETKEKNIKSLCDMIKDCVYTVNP